MAVAMGMFVVFLWVFVLGLFRSSRSALANQDEKDQEDEDDREGMDLKPAAGFYGVDGFRLG